MAKDFSIQDEYAQQSGAPMEEQAADATAAETVQFTPEQVAEMRELKNVEDYEGLGRYVADFI